MRVKTLMALLTVLLPPSPAALAAEEAPLPAAFLEFLAEMIEEEGELLDPLLLAPPPLQGGTLEPEGPVPVQTLPADGDAATGSLPDLDRDRAGAGGRDDA